MNVHALTRKEKRALSARGAKLYGIGGEAAVTLFQAYQFIKVGDLAEACRLVVPLTRSKPNNPHPWIVLGLAALNRREGKTAKAFFEKAAESAPKSVEVLTGLAKAHFLCAEPEAAANRMEDAFAAGSDEVQLIQLYLPLVKMLGRTSAAAALLEPIVGALRHAELTHHIAMLLAEIDDVKAAARWFERSHQLSPDTEVGKIDGVSALFHAGKMPETEARAKELLAGEFSDRDPLVVLLLAALRFQSKNAELLERFGAHEFSDSMLYSRAIGFAANAHQDLGEVTEARHAYIEAMHVSAGAEKVAKTYGAFCLGLGDYAEGVPNYFKRHGDKFRRLAPAVNSEAANLAQQDRVYLMNEQGIGDQLALLTLTRILPEAADRELVFVSEPREAALLGDNLLDLPVITREDFQLLGKSVPPSQIVALGDLVRFLPDQPAEVRQGPILRPAAPRVAEIRERYQALAEGRPIYGMAWAARGLIGRLRSVPLPELARLLPQDAFVVSLQYGDTEQEIAEAQAARPDIKFHSDPQVDQMADLVSFAAQVAALEQIVTIDNTTAHVCGALGHPQTHVLLPRGAENMWYWGTEARIDPWYGMLNLHRQQTAGDWSAALASVRAAIAG